MYFIEWCEIFVDRVDGRYFFEEDIGASIAISSNCCVDMFARRLILLRDDDLNSLLAQSPIAICFRGVTQKLRFEDLGKSGGQYSRRNPQNPPQPIRKCCRTDAFI